VQFIRVRRARKYILRVRPDGSLRVTIPRGGSRREAEQFLARHRQWAAEERLRVAARHAPVEWRAGDAIMLRGRPALLHVEDTQGGHVLVLAGERVRLREGVSNLRPAAETALRRLAARELLPRLQELAAEHGLTVRRAMVRSQRSRWGSCSSRGAIALNFRLVQMPSAIRDYVLLHELMHLRQQNHSRRYWRLVEEVCPAFRDAERWLRTEGRALF
jgi:predicted metal-dependent hydrolase